MTLEKARGLLAVQADMGGGCNRHGARLILAEVQDEYDQATVDSLLREFDLETLFGFAPGIECKKP